MVTIDTMIDGEGASITATRTVVLTFDRAGKAKIVKSTIRYETRPIRTPIAPALTREIAGPALAQLGRYPRDIERV